MNQHFDFPALRRMYLDPSKNDWSYEAISFALEHVFNVSLAGVCFVPSYLRDRVMAISPTGQFDRADLLYSISRLTVSRLQPGMFPLKHPEKYRTEFRIVAFLIHDDGRRYAEGILDQQLPEGYFAHWSFMAINLEEVEPWFYHYDSLEDYSYGKANQYATRLIQLGLITTKNSSYSLGGVRSVRVRPQPSDRSCGFWCLLNIIELATQQKHEPKKVLDTLLHAVDYVSRLGTWENLCSAIRPAAVLQNQKSLFQFLQSDLFSLRSDGLFMEPTRSRSILWIRNSYGLAILYIDTRDELSQLSAWMGIDDIRNGSTFHQQLKVQVIVLNVSSAQQRCCMDRLLSYLLAVSHSCGIGPSADESALIVKESLRSYSYNLHRYAVAKNVIATEMYQKDLSQMSSYSLAPDIPLIVRLRNTSCLEMEENTLVIRLSQLQHWLYRNQFASPNARSCLIRGIHYSGFRPVVDLSNCTKSNCLIMDLGIHWTLWQKIRELHRTDVSQQFSQLPPEASVSDVFHYTDIFLYLVSLMEEAE